MSGSERAPEEPATSARLPRRRRVLWAALAAGAIVARAGPPLRPHDRARRSGSGRRRGASVPGQQHGARRAALRAGHRRHPLLPPRAAGDHRGAGRARPATAGPLRGHRDRAAVVGRARRRCPRAARDRPRPRRDRRGRISGRAPVELAASSGERPVRATRANAPRSRLGRCWRRIGDGGGGARFGVGQLSHRPHSRSPSTRGPSSGLQR